MLEHVRNVAFQVDALLASSGAHERAPVVFIARNQPASLGALVGLLRAGRTIRMVYPFSPLQRLRAVSNG